MKNTDADHSSFKRLMTNLNLLRSKLKKNIASKDPHCQSIFNKDLILYLDSVENQIIELEYRIKKLEELHEEGVEYD